MRGRENRTAYLAHCKSVRGSWGQLTTRGRRGKCRTALRRLATQPGGHHLNLTSISRSR